MQNKLFNALAEIGVDIEETLERFMKDEAMYEKYLRRFPEEKSMKRLAEAVRLEDVKEAHEAAHTLKGIADNLGFVELVDLAVDMLYEFRNENPQEGMAGYKALETEYYKVCKVIEDSLE